jgi:single-strand DNA-binding protein
MRSKNLVDIMGNVGKTVTTKYTPSKTAVTFFSVATNESYKDKSSGDWKQITDWTRVAAWGRIGEIAGEHVKAGDPIRIIGRLRTRKVEIKGVTVDQTEVIAQELYFLRAGAKDVAEAVGAPDSSNGLEDQFDESDLDRQDA